MSAPLLKGGQGRDDREVRDSALAIVWPWLALVAFWVLVVLYGKIFGWS